MKLKPHHYIRTAYSLSVSAAILYCLWIIGYQFNPKVMSTLAVSALQSVGQPHYDFFVVGDVATGVLVMLLVYCLIKIFYRTKAYHKIRFWLCMGGLLAFGIMTAVACLFPSCDSNSSFCVLNLSQVFDVHNVTGTVASLGQFISLLSALTLVSKKVSRRVFWSTLALLIVWSISGLLFITLSTNAINSSLLMQHIFLVLSSLLLVATTWLLIQSKSDSSPITR